MNEILTLEEYEDLLKSARSAKVKKFFTLNKYKLVSKPVSLGKLISYDFLEKERMDCFVKAASYITGTEKREAFEKYFDIKQLLLNPEHMVIYTGSLSREEIKFDFNYINSVVLDLLSKHNFIKFQMDTILKVENLFSPCVILMEGNQGACSHYEICKNLMGLPNYPIYISSIDRFKQYQIFVKV